MKWTDYTTKETLEDNDELMILDKDANANKRTLMDKIWDYVVDKMTTAVIAKLGTTDKTLIGAVNELNSKTLSKTIHQQQSSNVESLIDKLISDIKEKKDGIFNIYGSWKNHASGYSAIVQKSVYDTLSIRISGIIFSFDGNLWIFTSDVKDNGTTTKKILFTMP